MRLLSLLLAIIIITSCSSSYKNSADDIKRFERQFTNDHFTLTGDYHWGFKLMGTDQHSTHTLYADKIVYDMKGQVYSTHYTMQKLSFDQSINKWIGQDEKGIVYVLFFKDKTDKTITIYKHKCKTKGIEEALAFDLPSPNATEDHGWNIYQLGEADAIDILPISGNYKYNSKPIIISDAEVIYNGKIYSKNSYHAGERRWVGENSQNEWLQIFVKDLATLDDLDLSVSVFDDLETAYQTKYQTVEFTTYAKE